MFPALWQENPVPGTFRISPGITKISSAEGQALVQNGCCLLLDVRTPQEFRSGHIFGALNLNVDDIDAERAAALIPSPDSVVMVYCRSGRRSKSACQKLQHLGYHYLLDLGGILDWPYGTVLD